MKIVLEIALAVLPTIPIYYLGWWKGRAYQVKIYGLVPCQVCEMRGRIAWYTLRAHRFLTKIPWIGKYILGAMVGFWYQKTLREGQQYGIRHTSNSIIKA